MKEEGVQRRVSNVSRILAEYVFETEYSDLPEHVVGVTKMALLDGIGVMLGAGTLEGCCKTFVNLATAGGGRQESSIIGFGAKVPSYMAAFANGSMAHALDFEDAHERGLVHSNAATIPAALAIAESVGGVTGKDVITAVTLGSDVVCRLGLALTRNPLEYGWYPPAILGAFGATTAASKILGLNVEQILDAFSLCLCQATCSAEIIHSPFSLLRAVRDSFAAKAGVLSALLAKEGVRGFDQPFEGKAGLFSLYAQGGYDAALLLHGLGTMFESANISFKPWPTCRGTHAYIEAALELMKTADFSVVDIQQVRVSIGDHSVNRKLCDPLQRKQRPETAIDAKFSIPFTVAVALVRGHVTLLDFTPEALVNPDVLDTARKVTYDLDANFGWKDALRGSVWIRLKSGEELSKTIDCAYGHPEHPINLDTLISKFRECAAYSMKKLSGQSLNRVIEMSMNLEVLEDIGALMIHL